MRRNLEAQMGRHNFKSKVVNITPEKNSNPRVVHLSNKLIAPKTTQNLRRQSVLKPSDANRPPRRNLPTPTQTHSPQDVQPTHNENPLPHLPIPERHNALPQNQRRVLHHASAGPQEHQKHAASRSVLEEALFQGEQDFISKVARTEKEICSLVEAGFEYVTEFEGAKIFK